MFTISQPIGSMFHILLALALSYPGHLARTLHSDDGWTAKRQKVVALVHDSVSKMLPANIATFILGSQIPQLNELKHSTRTLLSRLL